MGLRADVSQPSPLLHIHTRDLSCPVLCDPGDQSPFPLCVSRTDITPTKSPQPVFPPAFFHHSQLDPTNRRQDLLQPAWLSAVNRRISVCYTLWGTEGRPVLFSYEQAQYGVWTYNLTSVECDFFFFFNIVVCSRGLVENSPCILLCCSRKLNSTLPTKAWKCSWIFFQEKPFKPDYFSK